MKLLLFVSRKKQRKLCGQTGFVLKKKKPPRGQLVQLNRVFRLLKLKNNNNEPNIAVTEAENRRRRRNSPLKIWKQCISLHYKPYF